MQGCIAPSEVPGIASTEAGTFGAIAEELIYADFCTRYPRVGNQLFRDANNPSAYLYFLAVNNPQFTKARQTDYYTRLLGEGLMRIPDFLVHTPAEKAFYEVKPDSPSGMAAGVEKVGTLSAVYPFYTLPYRGGSMFTPRDHVVARLGTAIEVTLRVRRAAPGLLVYSLCLKSDGVIETATLAALLGHVVREMSKQRNNGTFRPVDLAPLFARNQQLSDLARTLGYSVAGAAAATVGWKWFWKAVVKRFALRGTTAAAIAAADGPLPIGDLVALGMTVWTIVDVVRLSDELWREARMMRDRGA